MRMNAELLQYRNEVVAIQGSRYGYGIAEDAFQEVAAHICKTTDPVVDMPKAWLLHATKMRIFTIIRGTLEGKAEKKNTVNAI